MLEDRPRVTTDVCGSVRLLCGMTLTFASSFFSGGLWRGNVASTFGVGVQAGFAGTRVKVVK